MKHVPPGLPGSIVSAEPRYENFIGGKWLAPTRGNYHVAPGEPENFSLPAAGNLHFVTRSPICVSPSAPGESVLFLHP